MAASEPVMLTVPRHKNWVKVSHWVITVSFFFLLFSGFVIFMSHPRLYWGEVGNDLTPVLLELPVSRNYKHSGWDQKTPFYGAAVAPFSASRTYSILNGNGWARSLHFLLAWVLVLTGLFYLMAGITGGHLRKYLLPKKAEMTMPLLKKDLVRHLRFQVPPAGIGPTYGLLQKLTYLLVTFLLLPVIVLTGLTMSPVITAAYPFLPAMFFGAQSARTIHFFASFLLVLFVLIHLVMIVRSGFLKQMRAMTIGK